MADCQSTEVQDWGVSTSRSGESSLSAVTACETSRTTARTKEITESREFPGSSRPELRPESRLGF